MERRLSTTAPAETKHLQKEIQSRSSKEQNSRLDAGATYLDVNIGPAENDGEDLMKWAVQLLQSEFDMFRLHWIQQIRKLLKLVFLYTTEQGKPIVNSADAGDRITNIDLAAAKRCHLYRTLLFRYGYAADNDVTYDALPESCLKEVWPWYGS